MIRWIKKLTHFGVSELTDQIDRRRLVLLNTFYLISSITFIAATIQSYLCDEARVFTAIFILCALFQVGLIFILKGFSGLAEIWLMLIVNINLFFFNNVQGLEAGVYLYFFPVLLANAYIADFRKPLASVISIGISFTTIIASIIIRDPVYDIEQTELQARYSFYFNMIMAALIMISNTVITGWLNWHQHISFQARMEEKNRSEMAIREALRQKEILLKEVHHRVKNNLAVMRSLLNLQMHSTTNETARAILQDSLSRVTSMAMIHQRVYGHTNTDELNFLAYITDLAKELENTYNGNHERNITISVTGTPANINLNQAIPAGLILNELISNAYKHAFTGIQEGNIEIQFTKISLPSGGFSIAVEDNGKGMQLTSTPENSESLGMTIVHTLTDQLDGKVQFTNPISGGTHVMLHFPA